MRGSKVLPGLLALVGFAVSTAALVPAASGAAQTVIDSNSVGSWQLGQSRSRAVEVFGAPTISADIRTENPRCRTFWRSRGLMIEFHGECSFTGRAWRATVTEPGWRTREGVRIGDSVKRLTSVYRGARATRGPSAGTVVKWGLMPLGVEWDLRRARPSSGVIVATQDGKVVGFELRRI